MKVAAVVQARMSSRRFPGKVLALFRNEPTIMHVLRAVASAVDAGSIAVATSTHQSDDVLAEFLEAKRVAVIRGDLENVLARFQQAARVTGADWILRVNADSPMLDGGVLRRVLEGARTGSWDLVTTIFPRTFPKGRNAEAIRSGALLGVDAQAATAEEREHVTRYFYSRPAQYRILNIESGNPLLANESLAVDTPDDLARLEAMGETALAAYASPRPAR
jgi:spore coat polysaccharide biosynthesis protein SpsF